MSNEDTKPDFVLKHRITGAAFLLFFGALLLPWLLGAPGGQKVATPTDKQSAEALLQDKADQAAETLKQQRLSEDERVYISKITPLDAQRSNSSNQAKPFVPDPGSKTGAKASTDTKKKPVVQSVSKAKSKPVGKKITTSVNRSAKTPTPKKSNDAVTKSIGSSANVTKSTAEKTQKDNVVAAENKPKIDVGWMVQVGVFTDKRGANRVVTDLRDKGFSPSTSIVDTNQGKNTGTRIWLGPFAQRVDAAKAKNNLTDKTGEAGFIRSYP